MKDNSQIRVLIAEDEVLVTEMIHGILEQCGYTVVGRAADGWQAVQMTESLRPDIILMDMAMPHLNGLDAARHIQGYCPTPIVMLTAYQAPDLVELASAVGVGAYLLKPPNAGEVERAITIALARFGDLMEQRRLNDELAAYDHSVAHDLKVPLAAISGRAEWLAQEATSLPIEEIVRSAQRITQTAQRMDRIINSLLSLAETRNEQVALEPLDMAAIVAEACERVTWIVEQYSAEIVRPAEWPVALGEPTWIEGVWVNYMSNAIKYGGRPPRIELGAEVRADGWVRFWVQDNGRGLSPEQLARLFGQFVRLDKSEPARGHGLGLSLVRRIVEKLGGQVSVTSENLPGRGSVFSFTLPGAPSPSRSAPPPAALGQTAKRTDRADVL